MQSSEEPHSLAHGRPLVWSYIRLSLKFLMDVRELAALQLREAWVEVQCQYGVAMLLTNIAVRE